MSNHLVIGLGKTGGAVLCSLRKRVFEEFRSNEPCQHTNIDYLYVDTSLSDLNNEEDWQTLGVSVQLAPAQRLFVDPISPSMLDFLDGYPSIKAFISDEDKTLILDALNEDSENAAIRNSRRLGRLLLGVNMCRLPQDTFIGYVHSRVRSLWERCNEKDVTFHICVGLDDTFGSGAIVDTIALIRDVFYPTYEDSCRYRIKLYLYLPGEVSQYNVDESINRYCQANCYAVLQELNAISIGCYYPTDLKGYAYENGPVKRLLKGKNAFDMAFLYTNVNGQGQEFPFPTNITNRVSDFLFVNIFSGFYCFPYLLRALYLSLYQIRLNFYNGKWPVHSRQFMTFGVKRIEYPEMEVVEYGACRFAYQSSMQMLYNRWDETRGFIECTEDMVGKNYPQLVTDPIELESNLLTEDYLTLSKPLPSIEKFVTNWKPIVQGWEFYTDRYKQDVQAECLKKEWYEEFNGLCNKFFDSMYRGVGVKKFYFDSESQLAGYAEEIVRRIEKNLLAKWKNGSMSIIEVHKYLNVLIANCGERVEDYKTKITRYTSYLNEDLADHLEGIRKDWNNIGWLRGFFTSASTKTFGRFVDAKREQLTLETTVVAYDFAAKLLSEVAKMLTLLSVNSVESFIKLLSDFAVSMNRQAEERCKLSDVDTADMKSEVVKIYDPEFIRETVYGFLKMKETQKSYSDNLRATIIEEVGTIYNGFYDMARKINLSTLQKVTLKSCMENAREEMGKYSLKHPGQRMVNVNILDKLRNSDCSTEDKRKQFVREIYDAAQNLLTFNGLEELKGSPETAACHQWMIQISLPMYEEDPAFRDAFIKDFGEISKIPFDKDYDVSVNFHTNQIVVIRVDSGFPLRYVDNVRLFRDGYNQLVGNDEKYMMLYSENLEEKLPSLYIE